MSDGQIPFLQMNGQNVHSWQPSGSGRLGAGHGTGPLEQFKLSPRPTDGSVHRTKLESASCPGVYLRMDATGVTHPTTLGGGTVNMQFGASDYEEFIVHHNPDGTVSFESKAFPNAYLRLSMYEYPGAGETGVVVNCQYSVAGAFEKFRLQTPPTIPRLRLLSYNTHLMADSFISDGSDAGRAFKIMDRTDFEDEPRRERIVRYAMESLADIVSLQEVWANRWEKWFVERLSSAYQFSYLGENSIAGTTSGLVLLSKYPLSDYSFAVFHSASGFEALANKGALCCVADIPTIGSLRIGTTHTYGYAKDIEVLVRRTVLETPAHRDMATIMFGDLNMHWTSENEYKTMRRIFANAGEGIYPATDAWIDLHGTGTTPDPFTISMRANRLAQLFSPERDTEGDDRIDFFWNKPGKDWALTPVRAEVPRNLSYESATWYFAHRYCCDTMPSAAVLNHLLCVTSKNVGNKSVLTAVCNRLTQMWKHYSPGIETSSTPGVVAYEGKFHMFYRDGQSVHTNGILHRSSTDGEHWSDVAYVGFDTGAGVCPVVYRDKLHLFYVDEDAKGFGGQLRYRIKERAGDAWDRSNWGGAVPIGITTRKDISAAVLGSRLCVVTKDNGAEDVSSGIMVAVQESGEGWQCGRFGDMSTSGAPGIVAVDNRFQLYYRDGTGNAIYHAWSEDGITWQDRNQNTMHDMMVGGVCPVVFDGKRLLFFPYCNTNKAYGYYQNRLMLQAQVPVAPVDLSDHFPLILEAEMRPHAALCGVMTHIQDIGDVTYSDGVWAGRRGEALRIEGFSLQPKIPNLGFSYMAHIANQGDTAWVPENTYVGTRGQNKAVEGFAIKLTGTAADQYSLTYRAHIQDRGDTAFVNAGDFCGNRGIGKRVEAMWIQLQKR
jgi:endonuclease/exonuclease/phosphatase family metal-dependent hydrolase